MSTPIRLPHPGSPHDDDLDAIFRRTNTSVLAALHRLLPQGAPDRLRAALFADAEREVAVSSADLERLEVALVQPLRLIVDRRGKGWRGAAIELCCAAVGGDASRFAGWSAMAELLHVGSLIVDDVEDGSTLRRGGPACHLVHGAALAINAGTFAYVLPQRLIQESGLPAATRLRLYEELVDALRIGHVGQGLDILGLADLLRAGASIDALAAANDAIHRCKSGWAFRMCARVGAILGDGTEAQIDALGRFFESLGVLFQRTDDLMDVIGFPGHHAARGEDLRNGKITYPLIRALARSDADGRARLLRDFDRAPDDDAVARMLGVIESSGALAECVAAVRSDLAAAWRALEVHLAPGPARDLLRAYSERTIDRFY